MMDEQQPLTEEQTSTIQTYCKNIDDFLAEFNENPSLKSVKFTDDVNIFSLIGALEDGVIKVAILKHLASCNEVFQIFKLVWNSLVKRNIETFFNMKKITELSYGIGNLTDCSDEFCCAFGEIGLLELVMQDLRTSQLVESHVSFALTIIYNCCWRVPENRAICREYIDILQGCSQSKDPEIQADAFLALSYIVDKSEVHKISLNEPCLKFLLLALKSAMSASDRRSRGYSALEILQGINQLAINDSNKLLIVKLNGIDILEDVLVEEGSNDKEKLWAARAIWQLAFKEENKVKIRQRTKLLNTLKKIKETSDDDDVIAACSGALFVINEVLDIDDEVKGHTSTRDGQDCSGHSSVKNGASAGRVEGHVMISYQHSSQERVLQVKRYLEECGFNVWMDVEKMSKNSPPPSDCLSLNSKKMGVDTGKGDILDAMAHAVQRAAVVLVCMTRRFKESRHCRTEATYAYTIGKDIVPLMLQDQFTPDDWLGALVGMKKYYPLYSDDVMRCSLPELARELGDRGKLRNSDLVVPMVDDVTGTSSPSVHGQIRLNDTSRDEIDNSGGMKDDEPTDNKDEGNSRTGKFFDVASWDDQKTREWLRSHGIDTSKESLKKVNGTRLKQIKNLLQIAPDFCLKSLKEELGLNLWEVLSFVEALKTI